MPINDDASDPLYMLLLGFKAKHLYGTLKENRIDVWTFTQLSEIDLRALGVEDSKLIEDILKSRQRKEIEQTYPFDNDQSFNDILSESEKKMLRHRLNLLTFQTNLKKQPVQDDLILPGMYYSEACIQGIESLINNLQLMDEEASKLQKWFDSSTAG